MSEQQPEYVWAHPEEKPKRGRTWLIVGLAIAAVVIAALVFWLFLRPGAPLADATPTASASASPSTSGTPSASASATPSDEPPAEPSAEPEPSMTPVDTAPPVADPSVKQFRGQVEGWLDDALTGLSIVEASSGQDAVAVVDNLQDDAQRLAEVAAPSSIASDWQDGLRTYSERLISLRAAAAKGSSVSVDTSRTAVKTLRQLVGL
ncbi:hypothetical protein ACIPV2_03635 [Microbacterium sp. NPDC089987]|uniref:hypothetical protein n=1 Tax=Microbacterium sp. NPDC089987 TaxID=3364202 RepID=UPI0038005876